MEFSDALGLGAWSIGLVDVDGSTKCSLWVYEYIYIWILWIDYTVYIYMNIMNIIILYIRFQKFWRSEVAPKPCGCLWLHHWHIFAATLGKRRTWVLLTTTRCQLPSLVIYMFDQVFMVAPQHCFLSVQIAWDTQRLRTRVFATWNNHFFFCFTEQATPLVSR